jgi:hypothetical protein
LKLRVAEIAVEVFKELLFWHDPAHAGDVFEEFLAHAREDIASDAGGEADDAGFEGG